MRADMQVYMHAHTATQQPPGAQGAVLTAGPLPESFCWQLLQGFWVATAFPVPDTVPLVLSPGGLLGSICVINYSHLQ